MRKHQIAEALLRLQAFKISLDPLFTWTSGLRSPVYCDLRALISDLETRKIITEGFAAMRGDWNDIDVIAGTATAGIPWAAWLAESVGKPMVYVRGAAKEHGTKKRIEGALKPGQRVLLVEDHISTGGSSVSAIEALRTEGQALANEIYAINTYLFQKAEDTFAASQVKVQTITNYLTILELAKEQGLIDPQKGALLADFRMNPSTWAEKHGL